ncbi:MAG: hypothetical protein QXV73_04085 [Candidatus Micrarchaeia archaeon]
MGFETATLISGIVSAVSGIVGAISALNPPKIHIPEVKLPEQDFAKIDAAIANNQALSEEARIAAQNAVRLYNEGKLIPAYQAKLDEWWNEAKKQVEQRLSAAGLQNSSIALQAINELNKKYASFYTDLLRTQLSDALSLSGLNEQYIKDLMASAQLKLSGAQIQQQRELAEAQLRLSQKAAQGQLLQQSLSSAASGFSGIGSALSSIQSTPKITLNPPTVPLTTPTLRVDTSGIDKYVNYNWRQ